MRKFFKLEHKEEKQTNIWSNHTELHFFKRFFFFCRWDFSERVLCDTSGWKMLMRHLLPADSVEILWTSFFSAERCEKGARQSVTPVPRLTSDNDLDFACALLKAVEAVQGLVSAEF